MQKKMPIKRQNKVLWCINFEKTSFIAKLISTAPNARGACSGESTPGVAEVFAAPVAGVPVAKESM